MRLGRYANSSFFSSGKKSCTMNGRNGAWRKGNCVSAALNSELAECVNCTPHRDGRIEALILLAQPVRTQNISFGGRTLSLAQTTEVRSLTLTLGRGVIGAIATTGPGPIAVKRTRPVPRGGSGGFGRTPHSCRKSAFLLSKTASRVPLNLRYIRSI